MVYDSEKQYKLINWTYLTQNNLFTIRVLPIFSRNQMKSSKRVRANGKIFNKEANVSIKYINSLNKYLMFFF